MPLTLEFIFSIDKLQKVWRVIRDGLSDDLVRDPFDYLAYEVNLNSNLGLLRHSIVNFSFTPRSALIVRGAKKDGLTRPLSFLEIEDLIVLKALCDSLQAELHKDFPEYVDFSRRLRTAFPIEDSEYEGWFDKWLRHQNRLTKIIAKRNGWKFIVHADISNFFSSINHALLRQTISFRSDAEEAVVNLLFYILEAMLHRPAYSVDHRVGLPQESHDASRILAHTFLYTVDRRFKKEGEEGRYARWVDDIVLSVNAEPEGKRVMNRLQDEIESRGMFLNTAKCRIVPSEKAITELWLEENEYLDKIHQRIEENLDIDLEDFEQRLETFLHNEKKENWNRILRRYYTESRRSRSSYLEQYVLNHITETPSEAKYILAYLESRPFNESQLQQILDYIKSEENCYEDIEIIIYEFLMRWSIPNDDRIKELCWKSALDHFFGRNGYQQPLNGHVLGLISLLCYKFGGRPALAEIAAFYGGSNDLQFLKYAFCCLVATEDFRNQSFDKAIAVEDISIRRLEKLVRELENNAREYTEMIKRVLEPIQKKFPNRFIMEPRFLPLVRICRKDDNFRAIWKDICERALERLKSTESTLQDHLSIAFLKAELTHA